MCLCKQLFNLKLNGISFFISYKNILKLAFLLAGRNVCTGLDLFLSLSLCLNLSIVNASSPPALSIAAACPDRISFQCKRKFLFRLQLQIMFVELKGCACILDRVMCFRLYLSAYTQLKVYLIICLTFIIYLLRTQEVPGQETQ